MVDIMSSYNRKSFDIAGYMFQADIVCPHCIAATFQKVPTYGIFNVESLLDDEARYRGIERMVEESFDSDEFPKVVFVDNITEGDVCGECGEEL
jgi:hypothetical protein